MNLKPFDLEAAKRGEPIVTRYGSPVKFIAHVPEAREHWRVVILTNGGELLSTSEKGYYLEDGESNSDIFMAPRKRTVWVNLYSNGKAFYYDSEDVANRCAGSDCLYNRAWPLEIEE